MRKIKLIFSIVVLTVTASILVYTQGRTTIDGFNPQLPNNLGTNGGLKVECWTGAAFGACSSGGAGTDVNIAAVGGNALTTTVPTQEAAPTSILNGVTNVTTAGTRVTLAGSTTVKGVTVCAKVTNTGNIFMGNVTVAAANGRILRPGECQSIAIANLQTVNLDSAVNGEGVTYIGVN